MSLTKEQLLEKIEVVKQDIANQNGAGRAAEVLTQYLDYLNDELKQLTKPK